MKKKADKKKKNPQGIIKGVENHSLTGHNKSHQIHRGEHPQIPTLPGNLFTLSQSGHHVIIGIKEYNRYYHNGSGPGKAVFINIMRIFTVIS